MLEKSKYSYVSHAIRTGRKIKKNVLYYVLKNGESYGVYLSNARRKHEQSVVDFCRKILGDNKITSIKDI